MTTRRKFLVGAVSATAVMVARPGQAEAATLGEIAVAKARTQIGKPYIWDAETPDTGFDCSGLVKWAWAQAGVDMISYTWLQAAAFREVSPWALVPGDLVFKADFTHVVLYSGNGNCVQARASGTRVLESACIARAYCVRPTLHALRTQPSGDAAGWQTTTVNGGETLYSLSLLHGVDLLTLARQNNLMVASPLVTGDRIILPIPIAKPRSAPTKPLPPTVPPTGGPGGPSSYVVVAGDTLAAIAGRWSTTVAALIKRNHITNPDRIFVGQVIYRP
jgi:NlpC/P60 family/LysM domain